MWSPFKKPFVQDEAKLKHLAAFLKGKGVDTYPTENGLVNSVGELTRFTEDGSIEVGEDILSFDASGRLQLPKEMNGYKEQSGYIQALLTYTPALNASIGSDVVEGVPEGPGMDF